MRGDIAELEQLSRTGGQGEHISNSRRAFRAEVDAEHDQLLDTKLMAPDGRAVFPSESHLEALLQDSWRRTRAEVPSLGHFLRNGENDRFERAVAFRIGHHLSNLLQEKASQWSWCKSVTVDMELHRRSGGDPKTADARCPDLIIHKRGTDENNFLVAEFKASSNLSEAAHRKDRETVSKLIEFLGYRFGVLATFDLAVDAIQLEWTRRSFPATFDRAR